ncbi:DUF2986 domain-containing protein [Shewanella sp. Choline-02u-19]|jgi:hypothetical protein|uniref:DUF2986 domain-containing protein n=1 Tax=unclassified Shewanella TaxID=196818 RepID=UPI000C32CCBD|nr:MULTISPECIES: DUF2986 domain-containing protein [unclassified Shewanella]PKG58389.1 DUF2986 domain-containing protein [Shewanella sp. GutDb-MelDb]PKG73339.1 DUF2986 domain-containing protein [Shewanella sp. GutCb]PKH59193.1 DUF2986 domain-containing protein [Shewanella sp. Bg11-22]PKI27068.1 DUF2986 domain-containing protein [Shewanella sp. Choline-02u-19]
MNKKQKMIKMTAKRAKARLNKHTPPTIKKYVSKAERAENLAKLEAEELAAQSATATEVSIDTSETDATPTS